MHAHMTNGTLDFLKKLTESHPQMTFYFMTGSGGALAYYEDRNKKSIFSSGRSYEVLKEAGDLIQEGYVIMSTIPITEENQAAYEDRIKSNLQQVLPGSNAFRFLRPTKGNKYVVLIHWNTVSAYEIWKRSDNYDKTLQILASKKSAYHGDIPFTTSYHMHKDEAEKSS
ncbi:antibiotic biosynthesis monooxygenase family protein [Oceanobacillus senegalensis]|uniref:antibiotic biosynthesis monooxygenase family protein n=1 Tax=Oceanobacillus senegalensis TaxID=1936063 RepID=UPI000A312187|nr:antibiotic biosynthesis monooxygenase [Oceanobacillus senegalensis]